MSKSNKDELRDQVIDLLKLRDLAAMPFLIQPGRPKTALEVREAAVESAMDRHGMSREDAEKAVDAFI